jgi:hypothetical protein
MKITLHLTTHCSNPSKALSTECTNTEEAQFQVSRVLELMQENNNNNKKASKQHWAKGKMEHFEASGCR